MGRGGAPFSTVGGLATGAHGHAPLWWVGNGVSCTSPADRVKSAPSKQRRLDPAGHAESFLELALCIGLVLAPRLW